MPYVVSIAYIISTIIPQFYYAILFFFKITIPDDARNATKANKPSIAIIFPSLIIDNANSNSPAATGKSESITALPFTELCSEYN